MLLTMGLSGPASERTVMHAITGYLKFKPEDREQVLAGLADIAELSRKDPGCVDYFWAEAVDEPNTFRFFECWESEELLNAHLAQPHEKEFMERFMPLVIAADAYVYDPENRRSAMG
jgi:quinol monooxygenase YgiN